MEPQPAPRTRRTAGQPSHGCITIVWSDDRLVGPWPPSNGQIRHPARTRPEGNHRMVVWLGSQLVERCPPSNGRPGRLIGPPCRAVSGARHAAVASGCVPFRAASPGRVRLGHGPCPARTDLSEPPRRAVSGSAAVPTYRGGAGPGGGSDRGPRGAGAGVSRSVSAGGISGTRAPRGVWAEQTFKHSMVDFFKSCNGWP